MSLEIAKTEARYLKQQERLERDFDWSSTTGPMAITQNYIKRMVDGVPEYLKVTKRNEEDFIELIKELPKETIALCILSSILNTISCDDITLSGVLAKLGRAIEGECFANSLKVFDYELTDRLERLARRRHGNLKYRRQAVRSLAKKNKFKVERWSNKQLIIAGNWILNVALSVLPDVFSLVVINNNGDKQLALSEDAFTLAENAIKQAILANPVYMPRHVRPNPWTDWDKGGPIDPRLNHHTTLLRSRHSEVPAFVRAAIADGTMQPALDALNSIQAVGWRINQRILEVIKYCHANCVSVPGLPRAKNLDPPARSKAWEDMSEDEQKAWKIRANLVKLRNRGFMAERVLMVEDLTTAEHLGNKPFYVPCNMDWRGRVYGMCHFNYQREDRVRALFEFANGVPMTEEGLYWLKVHVANTGDFNKVSKRPFDERVKWVDDNLTVLIDCATMANKEVFWHNADKPFQFLAACMELADALNNPQHVTHLPIAFDGSCSGLQHLSAMTKAAEGALVNLTHSDAPQDIYSIVAERVEANLKELLKRADISQTDKNLCTLCLEYGITRSLVKRNVMTYGYSSQRFGMASQLMEDLMRPLALEVLAGERPFHPFGSDNGFTASRFLASQIFEAIEQVVKKPAEAMGFLRTMAKALAHENKPVTWITPVGVPWVNRYHQLDLERVTLWLNDKGVIVPHTVASIAGTLKYIDKTKAANSIAPNVVHALDASHLMMTVNGLVERQINDFALVHDSFGVHAPHAGTLGVVLREQFVSLYTDNDPLRDILESNKDRMDNPSRLPRPVTKGPLDIREVLDAEYAFA